MEHGRHLTVITQLLPLRALPAVLLNHTERGREVRRGHFVSFSKAVRSTQAVPKRAAQPAFKSLLMLKRFCRTTKEPAFECLTTLRYEAFPRA